jgi:hypothetical protein
MWYSPSNWGTIKGRFPQGLIVRPLSFIVHINDLPLGKNTYSEPVLFADDTSVLITASNLNGFQIKSMSVLNRMKKWPAANGLIIHDYR